MHKITQSVIDSLAETKGEEVLTLYLPTHKISTPATNKEDQTRYRTLLASGLQAWEDVLGADAIKSTRQQLEAYTDDPEFWNETQNGLAIFAQRDGVTVVHLPIECSEFLHVDDSFDLAPLRVAYSQDQQFYVLALAKHNPKLYYGDSYNLEEVDLELPESPEDALNIDEMFSGSNTVRGMASPGGGNDTLSTHGQGDSNHAGQEEHLKYLRIIDNKIIKSDKINHKLPLLLAATESEASDFKRISNNQNLLEQYVAGNHTITPLHELHGLVWDVICKSVVDMKTTKLLDQFNEDKGRQKASSDLSEIAEAIKAGRVGTLLVGIIEKTKDSVKDTGKTEAPLIRLHDKYLTSNLYNLVQSVVQQGGEIVGIRAESLATPTMVGALYRY